MRPLDGATLCDPGPDCPPQPLSPQLCRVGNATWPGAGGRNETHRWRTQRRALGCVIQEPVVSRAKGAEPVDCPPAMEKSHLLRWPRRCHRPRFQGDIQHLPPPSMPCRWLLRVNHLLFSLLTCHAVLVTMVQERGHGKHLHQ